MGPIKTCSSICKSINPSTFGLSEGRCLVTPGSSAPTLQCSPPLLRLSLLQHLRQILWTNMDQILLHHTFYLTLTLILRLDNGYTSVLHTWQKVELAVKVTITTSAATKLQGLLLRNQTWDRAVHCSNPFQCCPQSPSRGNKIWEEN